MARTADRDGARLREPVPERNVRRGVLVEERVVVDAARLADARGRVDERDLAQALRVRDRARKRASQSRSASGSPRAGRGGRSGTRPRAPRSLGRRNGAGASSGTSPPSRRRRARRSTPRSARSSRCAGPSESPRRRRATSSSHDAEPEIGAAVADVQLAELEPRELRRAAADQREVVVAAGVPGRVFGAEPAEGEQLPREPPLCPRGVRAREDARGPVRRRPRADRAAERDSRSPMRKGVDAWARFASSATRSGGRSARRLLELPHHPERRPSARR